jgi:hypothetical protein
MSVDWLTAEDIKRLWDIPFVTLHHWRRLGCPALGGRRLRARKQRGRGKRPQHVFYRPDVEAAATQPTFTGTLHDASGDWLSVRVARERYGFSPNKLMAWRNRPCPQLGGRKLRAQLVSVVEESGRCRAQQKRWVHHAEDLARLAAGVQQDGDWLSGALAAERYGFSTATLYLWHRRGCLYLGGGKLRSRKAPRSTSHGQGERLHLVRVYAREDLETITRNQRISPEATAERDWLTYREAKQLYGLNQPTLSGWRLHGARALGGRRLAAKKVLAGVGDRMMVVWKYARADLEKIARTEEGETLPEVPVPTAQTAAPPPRSREYDAETARLYKFCYEELRARIHKRSRICELAKQHCPDYELVESDITNYARRHAKRNGLPWPV